MKRSRACEDLVALESHIMPTSRFSTKRNKTDDLSVHAFALAMSSPSLLTRSASAEEELSLLLEANALANFDRLSNELSLEFDDVDDDLFLAHRASPRVDTRALSLREKEVRDAKQALQFKQTNKFHAHDGALLMNSPDSPESHLFQHYASRESRTNSVFDMTSISMVLHTHAA